jgi:nitric oxide reductase NorE protein
VTDGFFMWYFVLTGIHLLHVVVGTILLGALWNAARRRRWCSTDRVVPECVASFWHLVDVLWIVLFPLLYLQR